MTPEWYEYVKTPFLSMSEPMRLLTNRGGTEMTTAADVTA